MKLIRLILATTPALLFAAVTPPVRSAGPEFYVAPQGADTWSGTRPEPNTVSGDVPRKVVLPTSVSNGIRSRYG